MVNVTVALMTFPVWAALNRLGLPADEMAKLRKNLLESGIRNFDPAFRA